jgi:hypothetical protein
MRPSSPQRDPADFGFGNVVFQMNNSRRLDRIHAGSWVCG